MARGRKYNQTLSNEALGLYVDDELVLSNVWEGVSKEARVIGFFDDGRPVVVVDDDGSNYGSDDWETYKDGINSDYLDAYDIEYDIEQGDAKLWALSNKPEDKQFRRAEIFGLGLGDEIELGRTKNGSLIITNKEWDTTGRYPPVKATVIGFKTNAKGKITAPLLGIDRKATKIKSTSAKWDVSKQATIAWRYQEAWGENSTSQIHQDQGFAYITAKTVFNRILTNQDKPATQYQATPNKEHKQMSNTRPAFLDMVKTDASNAGYRIAAHQLTKGTKTAIATLLAKQGGSSNGVKAIEEMLDTEYGQAAIAMALGLGIHYAPVGAMKDPRVQRIADELRINSMSSAGNQIMNELMELLMPVLSNAIAAIPNETNARIATTSSAQEEEEHVEKAYKIKAA